MASIVIAPNEILRSKLSTVNFSADKLSKIVEEMRLTLLTQKNPQGVGLAANQIGLPHRIFLARWTTKKDEPIHVFINPEIIDHSEELQGDGKKDPLEGCLSLPKFYGHVKRFKWVKLQYKTISNNPTPISNTTNIQSSKNQKLGIGNWKLDIACLPARQGVGNWLIDNIETFEGFPAVVIQHEMDHLNGKIFVERILEQNGVLYRITDKKDEEGKEIWERVEI